MTNINQLKGGLYGMLIGDALGVPYEFHLAREIPTYDEIEMEPPIWFTRAHVGVPAGTWSDDGAQALCLLDSLLSTGQFDLDDFSDKLLAWYNNGLWAVGGFVFDVGNQTELALKAYRRGLPARQCGNLQPGGKGNGALMRVLPLVLWHDGEDAELVRLAHEQCLITHGNITNQVCCALYCLIGRALLHGATPAVALEEGIIRLSYLYANKDLYARELNLFLDSANRTSWCGQGKGYVVDSLKSAIRVLLNADSYESAIKSAIALGNDTDTTACIAGGLAGLYFGYEAIPERWVSTLRGKEMVEPLWERLLYYICR